MNCGKKRPTNSNNSNASSLTLTMPYRLNGEAAGDQFGYSVASAGDVNGDGKMDFIVGAPFADNDAGSAYVYSGADGSLLYKKNGLSAGNEDQFGISVAGVGDINGDGKGDFIIGAWRADLIDSGSIDNGSAFLYSGANGALLYRKDGFPLRAVPSALFGYAVAGPGDVNGDAVPDFIVTSITGGNAYVYSGANGDLLYQRTGYFSVSKVGDVDADGKADFITGGGGSAYIYSGGAGVLLHRIDGGEPGDQLGNSVSGVGDIDGDARPDIIVGAPNASRDTLVQAGWAFVFSGVSDSLRFEKSGGVGDRFGFSVSGGGDINGDGKNDFIVGAPQADLANFFTDAGSAYVYSGQTGGLLYRMNGFVAHDRFGSSVALIGDVNSDNRADFIVGAPLADPSGVFDCGAVYVFSVK